MKNKKRGNSQICKLSQNSTFLDQEAVIGKENVFSMMDMVGSMFHSKVDNLFD